MSCHVDLQHCTNDSNLLSSVSDVAIKVEIYQNENELNLDHFIKDLSSYSIQVPVGDKLQLKCLSNEERCEGQWMRDNANATQIISAMLLEWSEITEETQGAYTCHTKQLCTNQKISVVIDVIKNGELALFTVFSIKLQKKQKKSV